MISMIKFMITFSVSFLILSIPVGEHKKVFDHVDDLAKPYTSKLYSYIQGAFRNGLQEGSRIGKSLIENTSPTSLDRVKSNSSSVHKVFGRKDKNLPHLPKDDYTPQEREALLNILQQSEN